MQEQGQSGGPEHAQQLRVEIGAKAAEVVRDVVEGFCGQTVLPVRTRSLTWPGVNGVEPEPIACLEGAKALERAARTVQLGYIRLARQAGRTVTGTRSEMRLTCTGLRPPTKNRSLSRPTTMP